MREKYSLILAAGKGKRMKSDIPKSLTKLKGKTLIERTINNLEEANITKRVAVLGYKAEEVEKAIKGKCDICFQQELLGTANAVLSSCDYFANKKCDIVIVAADMPFVSGESLKKAVDTFEKEKLDLLVLTAITDENYGYGRIIRNENGEIIKIVEEKDCTDEEKKIKEVNSSIYIVKSEEVFKNLKKIKNNNAQNEFYLTDLVSIYRDNQKKVSTFLLGDKKEILGINDFEDLKKAEQMFYL